jgi:hypothetical protein
MHRPDLLHCPSPQLLMRVPQLAHLTADREHGLLPVVRC